MPSAPDPAPRRTWWQRVWDGTGPGPEPAPLSRWQHTWRLALAVVISVGAWLTVALPWERTYSTARWSLVVVDAIVGLGSLWVYQRRRQRPLAVALVLTVLSAVFTAVTGPAVLAFASLAARRHLRGLLLVLPVTVAASLSAEHLVWSRDLSTVSVWGSFVTASLTSLATAAVAYAVGARRAVRQSQIEGAEAAEREQTARAAQAQAAERARIAREMHDVLAHRISLVAMHAGALNYRQDLSDEERRTATATIERNAREALTELREVLGVLRDPDAVGGVATRPEAPQPALRDLGALVVEARTLGASVDLTDESGAVSERAGRTAYRVVQEALTNARKHAPGAPVAVSVTGGDQADLVVTVSQPEQSGTGRFRAESPPPGSGLGLVGLKERVELAGGSFRAGPDSTGSWVVTARLPWSS